MRQPIAAVVLVSLTFTLSACRHYWVPERALDAYASLPRVEKRVALLPAQRDDGSSTWVRARDARPLPSQRGDARAVRVAPRAKTSVGIVLLIEGAGLFSLGVALAVSGRNDHQCSNDACGAPIDAAIGGTLAGFGGVELLTGTALIASGAAHTEVAPDARRFVYLP
jgi:hypothetical protein